ncbi:hypothetical protein AAMO2058_001449200 [Amorphochlora amoebiformis]
MRYRLILDVGREKNTWMPPQWAASGRRMEIHMLVNFLQDGQLEARMGPYLDMSLKGGTWSKGPNNRLKFNIAIGGFERFDVSLPEGLLYFSSSSWGGLISERNNIITIRATRFLVRKEWRMVGTFRAIPIPTADKDPVLSPCRITYRPGGGNPGSLGGEEDVDFSTLDSDI